MKISDLYEDRSSEFDDSLMREVMDILILYKTSGTPRTNINNIISELNKTGLSVDQETISELVEKMGYTVDDQTIVFYDEDETPLDDLTDGEEYDEVESLAQDATDKRMK